MFDKNMINKVGIKKVLTAGKGFDWLLSRKWTQVCTCAVEIAFTDRLCSDTVR